MAKSLEDTAFYRYHRLLALNEVGGDPAAKALPVDAFHDGDEAPRQRLAARHDRDRDARHQARRGRARAIDRADRNSRRMDQRGCALESPERAASGRSTARCARRRRRSNTCCTRRCSAPGRRASATTSFVERMQAYALKAAREGKQETSWLNPNEAYEAGLRTFIERILDPRLSAEFLDSLADAGAAACAAGRAEFAQPAHAQGDDAGRARFLSGHGVLGSVAGRSRQPPAGGFCRARRRAGVDGNAGLGTTSRRTGPTVI